MRIYLKYILPLGVILLLNLTNCATTSSNNDQNNLLDNFDTSNSMCTDAIILHMKAAKCEEIVKEVIDPSLTMLTCVQFEEDAPTSVWLLNDFFAIPQRKTIPDDLLPICADSNSIIATAEKD
jgi:hypothetical protein